MPKINLPGRGEYEYEYTPQCLAQLPAGVATAIIRKEEDTFMAQEMFPVWAKELGLPADTIFHRNLTEGGDSIPEGGTCWDYEVECEACDGSGRIESRNIRHDCPCCDGSGHHEGGLLFVGADHQIADSKEY
jgi:hypothetical protein